MNNGKWVEMLSLCADKQYPSYRILPQIISQQPKTVLKPQLSPILEILQRKFIAWN